LSLLDPREPPRQWSASPRQAEILNLVAFGLSDKEIARRLGVSIRTVRTHLEIYFRRSRQHNRIGALRAWRDAGS
jgi:DNA-binding NarL/FixJ family response regulator